MSIVSQTKDRSLLRKKPGAASFALLFHPLLGVDRANKLKSCSFPDGYFANQATDESSQNL